VTATNEEGLQDVTVYIVNITATETIENSVFFDIQANERGTFCPVIPDTFGTNLSSTLMIGGMEGSSDFALFSVDAETGCITYNPGEFTGEFVDSIAVITCDLDLDICIRTTFIATITPSLDTINVNIFEGEPVEICIPTVQLFSDFDSIVLCNEPLFGTIDAVFCDYR